MNMNSLAPSQLVFLFPAYFKPLIYWFCFSFNESVLASFAAYAIYIYFILPSLFFQSRMNKQ